MSEVEGSSRSARASPGSAQTTASDVPEQPVLANSPQPAALVEFVIADTCRISGRGTAAMPEGDPRPWWPICWHRVRVSASGGQVFEAEAGVNLALRLGGMETMVLLFRDLEPQALPPGSRVVSLATSPYEVKVAPPPPYDVKVAQPPRRWWQFWK